MSHVAELSNEEVLRFIQWLCPKAGIHSLTVVPSSNKEGYAVGKTGRKETKYVLVPHQRWPHILGIRSILTIKNPDKPHSWLINGQPGRNTHALRFDGENGPCLIPSHESVKKFLQAKYTPESFDTYWANWMKGAGLRALEHDPVIAIHLGYTNEIIERLP